MDTRNVRVGRPYIKSKEITEEYLNLSQSAFSYAKNSQRNFQRAQRATQRLENIEEWFEHVKGSLDRYQIAAFRNCFKVD